MTAARRPSAAVCLLALACRREPPPPRRPARPPRALPARPPPAPPLPPTTSLRVGVNGTRHEPAASACRGYALRYGLRARNEPDRESASDVAWPLGQGAANTLTVRPRRPVAFSHVAVEWYGLPSPGHDECAARVDLEVDGRVVAALAPPDDCAAAPVGRTYRATTRLALPAPVTARRLRLADRTPRPLPSEGDGYLQLTGIALTTTPPARLPTVVAATGDAHPPVSGEGPGGWRWSLDRPGLFVVAPGRPPRAVRGELTRGGAELAVEPVPDASLAFLAAPGAMGNRPPLSRRLYRLDAATDTTPSRIAEYPADVREIWWDRCAGALRVELETGARALVLPDGRATALPPAAAED